jgi:hypothetical protein
MAWKYHDRGALLDRLTRPNPPRDHVFLFGSALTAPRSATEPGVPGVAGVVQLIREYYAQTFDSSALLDFERALAAEPTRAYQAAFEHLLGRVSVEEANRVIRRAVTMARVDTAAIDETTLADTRALHAMEQELAGWHLTPAVRAVGELLALKTPGFSPLVLTTNFDPLLEVSIERAGRPTLCSALDTDGRLDQVHSRGCHVVHLHGYWLRSNTLHTGGQLQQDRPQLQASLERVLANCAIVVIGYGGWDDVFTKALSAMLEDPQHNIEILWAFYPSDVGALNRSAEPLLEQLRSGYERSLVTLFRGIDLHSLLPELRARLSAPRPAGRRVQPASSPGVSHSGESYAPLGASAERSGETAAPLGAAPAVAPSAPDLAVAEARRASSYDTPAAEVRSGRRWSRIGLVALACVAALVVAVFFMRSQPLPESTASAEPPVALSNPAAAEQTVRRYWAALDESDYAAAWPLLSPGFQSSVHHGSFAEYEREHRKMPICSVSIQRVSVIGEFGDNVELLVPMSIATGASCKTRQQTYAFSLVRSSSNQTWLIDRVSPR